MAVSQDSLLTMRRGHVHFFKMLLSLQLIVTLIKLFDSSLREGMQSADAAFL